jgi:hypothetical protein
MPTQVDPVVEIELNVVQIDNLSLSDGVISGDSFGIRSESI